MAMRTGNRQSGGRQSRQAKLSGQLAAPVYITRKIAYYDFLDEDVQAAIEAQAYTAQRK
jgi:trimethylamine:corrinoid methyltransferase-like protein